MDFDGACIPILEVREVCTEFDEVGAECGSGDVNADGIVNTGGGGHGQGSGSSAGAGGRGIVVIRVPFPLE